MPRQVVLNSNVRDIVMPNGIRTQGGATVILSDQDYSKLSATFKTANLAADTAVPGSDYFSGQQIASGETTIPRVNAPTGQTMVSQTLHLTYWTAAKSETVNNLAVNGSGIAAAATPSYVAFGVYQVNANSSLTLLGAVANDITIFSTVFTLYTRAVTTPFQKFQGQRYAFGLLVVSAAAMPNAIGYNGTVADTAKAPTLARTVTGQSTLPASIASGSLAGTSSMYYGEVTP